MSTEKLNFDNFVENTGFFGIQLAHRKRHLEKLLWCILFVIAFCLTAKDIVALTIRFLAMHPVIDVSVMHSDTITLPNPTICLRTVPETFWNTAVRGLAINIVNQSNVQQIFSFMNNLTDLAEWMETNANHPQISDEHAALVTLATLMYFNLGYAESMLLSSYPNNARNHTWTGFSWIGDAPTKFNLFHQSPNPTSIPPDEIISPNPTSVPPDEIISPNPTSVPPDEIINPNPTSVPPDEIISTMEWSKLNFWSYLKSHKVNLVQLRHALGVTWLSQLQVTFRNSSTDAVPETAVSKEIELVWFGPEPFLNASRGSVVGAAICFRFVDEQPYFTFKKSDVRLMWSGISYGNLEVTGDPVGVPVAFRVRPNCFDDCDSKQPRDSYLSIFPIVQYILAQDRIITDITRVKQTITFNLGLKGANFFNNYYTTVLLKTDMTYVSLDQGPHRCQEQTTLLDCRGACLYHFYVIRCSCKILEWHWERMPIIPAATAADSLPFCGLEQTSDSKTELSSTCAQSVDTEFQDVTQCMEQCKAGCDRFAYTAEYLTDFTPPYQQFSLAMASFEYVAITEQVDMSTQDFIGGLGGILGVWFGANMIAVIHVLVWVFKLWWFRNSDKNVGSTSEQQKESDMLKNFVATSGISGIALAHSSRQAEKFFWILIILVAICGTAFNVAQIIQQYLAVETVTDMDVMDNSSLQLPQSTICLTGLVLPSYCAGTSEYNDYYGYTDTSDCIQLDFDNFKNFLSNQSDISQWLIDHVQDPSDEPKHLLLLGSYIYLLTSQVTASLLKSDMEMKIHDGFNLYRLALPLRNYLVSRGVDLVRFRHALVFSWIVRQQLSFTRPGNIVPEFVTNMTDILPTWFGLDTANIVQQGKSRIGACFQMSGRFSSVFRFEKNNRMMWLSYKPTMFYEKPSLIKRGPGAEGALIVLFSNDLTPTPVSQNDNAIVYQAQPEYMKPLGDIIELSYKQWYKSLGIHVPCTDGISENQCKLQCQAKFIADTCQCYPISLLGAVKHELSAELSLCEAGTTNASLHGPYLECITNASSVAEKSIQNCTMNSCLPSCTKISFTFNTLSYRHGYDSTYRIDSLGIRVQSYQYMNLTERKSMTVSDLIGNLGGFVGLWTGASALGYIHLLVYALKWLRSKCKLQSATNQVRGASKTEVGIDVQQHASNDFVESNGIFGIKQAWIASKTERWLWIILLIAACCLTLQELVELVEQYKREDTVTESVLASSANVALPNPAVCLTLDAKAMWRAYSNQWGDMLSTILASTKLLDQTRSIPKWMFVSANETVADDGEYVTAITLLGTYMFLGLGYVETLATTIDDELNADFNYNATTIWQVLTQDTAPEVEFAQAIIAFWDYIVSHNVNVVELRRVLVTTWLMRLQLALIYPNKQEILFGAINSSSINAIQVTWIGPKLPLMTDSLDYWVICFRGTVISQLTFNQSGSSNWLEAAFTIPEIPFTFIHSLAFVFANDPTLDASSAPSYSSKLLLRPDEFVYRTSNMFPNAYMTYDQHLKGLNLKDRRCSNVQTKMECKGQCYANFIASNCGCNSLLWLSSQQSFTANKPWCGFGSNPSTNGSGMLRYADFCSIHPDQNETLRQCIDKCIPHCETAVVTFHRTPDELELSKIKLRMTDFMHVVFTIRLRMTSEDFMGNLGGIIGAWTGGCILAYIHVLLVVVNWIYFHLKHATGRINHSGGKQVRNDAASDTGNAKSQRVFGIYLNLEWL